MSVDLPAPKSQVHKYFICFTDEEEVIHKIGSHQKK